MTKLLSQHSSLISLLSASLLFFSFLFPSVASPAAGVQDAVAALASPVTAAAEKEGHDESDKRHAHKHTEKNYVGISLYDPVTIRVWVFEY